MRMDHAIELGDRGILAPGRWRWLRALGWMVALFAILSAICFPGWLRHLVTLTPAMRDPVLVGAAIVAVLVYAWLVRSAERRSPSELAPTAMPRDLLIGIAIGLGMFTLVFAILRLTGSYTLSHGAWSDWGSDLGKTLATGLREELLIRLILFRLLMRAFGLSPALVISALFFGLGHLANPNANMVAAIAIAIEAGLMLAGFYILTGRIWMSVGVHAAWNFAQGPIFGARISGFVEQGSLFVSGPVAGAPDWLSGGAFGPEASVPAILVGAAVFGAVLVAARRRAIA